MGGCFYCLGIVFKLNSDGSGFSVLRHFSYPLGTWLGVLEPGSLSIGRDGGLYGTSSAVDLLGRANLQDEHF